MRNVRRQQVSESRRKRRLIIFTFSLLLAVYLTFTLILGDKGLLRYIELKSTKSQLVTETLSIKERNEDISGHIDLIEKNPGSVEELAREYGLTKEGEIIFKFDDE